MSLTIADSPKGREHVPALGALLSMPLQRLMKLKFSPHDPAGTVPAPASPREHS